MSYYQRFILCFSKVASPLYQLTKKDVTFEWTAEQEKAFNQLKSLLTSATVLAFPQFDQEFLLETDASGLRFGAVLAQKQDDGLVHSIAYNSCTL